jgi:hypothetical protein
LEKVSSKKVAIHKRYMPRENLNREIRSKAKAEAKSFCKSPNGKKILNKPFFLRKKALAQCQAKEYLFFVSLLGIVWEKGILNESPSYIGGEIAGPKSFNCVNCTAFRA